MMSLADIATATSGKLIGEANIMINGVCTDSREDCSQRLFIAIEGDNFDGHNHVAQAKTSGAVAAMLSRKVESDLPNVLVANTLQGMAALTKSWRQRFAIPVVGITGSVGKTSLKEIVGAILSIDKNGIVTEGNFNNEIGVPLTVMRLKESHQFAVIEMGMNNFGEIERLSAMTRPTIAVINNAAAAHLEKLGSIEGVAKAKGEIVASLPKDGVLIINGDDKFSEYWSSLAGDRRVVKFGLQESMDVTACYEFDKSGTSLSVRYFDQKFKLHVPLWGKHNVMNVLASIAIAKELFVSNRTLQSAFDRYTPPQDRLGRYNIDAGVLIDDSYNANPTSIGAAIDQLELEKALNPKLTTVLVLGDMGELGEEAKMLHQQVGITAKNRVDHLYLVGDYANDYASGFGGNARIFVNQTELINALNNAIVAFKTNNVELCILVKGSRFARMDRVVAALQEVKN